MAGSATGCASRVLVADGASQRRPRSPDAPADPELRLRLVPADDWKLTAGVYDEVRGPPARACSRATNGGGAGGARPAGCCGRAPPRCAAWWPRTPRASAGYARYATKQYFDEDFGSGQVDVREVLAVDPAALATLYRYLFDLDLMGSTTLWNVPVDDPLLHWLENPRRAKPEHGDALYVRLVDLPAALSARTYSADVDVVLEVDRPALPLERGPVAAHRWHRRGDLHPHRRPCRPDARRPRPRGRLPGRRRRCVELAGAGRVSRRPRTRCRRPATRSRSDLAPWCPVVF